MKEIIKLLPQDNQLKIKMLGYQIGLIIMLIVGYMVSLVLLESSNLIVAIIGYISSYVTIVLVAAISMYVYINKLLVTYYPNFRIRFGDAVKKILAVFVIMLINIIIFTIICTTIINLIEALNSGLLAILGLGLYIYFLFQMAGVSLALMYTIFENVECEKFGFKAVFKTYFNNVFVIRKVCVKISSATIVAAIILYILYIVVATIIYAIITIPVLYVVLSRLASVVFIILLVWLVLTNYVYIFKKYRQVANMMEV